MSLPGAQHLLCTVTVHEFPMEFKKQNGIQLAPISISKGSDRCMKAPLWPVLQNCLRSVLEHVAVYGQAVFRLQGFIDEVTGHTCEPGPPGSSHSSRKGSDPPFRTYQAFVWALYKYFASFKEELTTIEKDLIGKGRCPATADYSRGVCLSCCGKQL